jgi:predicted ester cyclase
MRTGGTLCQSRSESGTGIAEPAADGEQRQVEIERMSAAGLQTELLGIYRNYIACLNGRNWPELGRFVDTEACHNGRPFGISGYRAMLEQDCRDIPDLRFNILLLVCEPPYIASRLAFDCRPAGMFLGLPVNGRRVAFTENVFYEFADGRIRQVWSAIDKAAIEAQLS